MAIVLETKNRFLKSKKTIAVIKIEIAEEEERTGRDTYKECYYTSFSIETIIEGVMGLAKSKKIDVKDFCKLYKEIETFGNWLDTEGNNRELSWKLEAERRLEHTHLPVLKERLDAICDKYGLIYSEKDYFTEDEGEIINGMASAIGALFSCFNNGDNGK